MEPAQITFFSYISGSIMFAALSMVSFYLWRLKVVSLSILIASLASMAWHIFISFNYVDPIPNKPDLLVFEVCRYGAWIVALLHSLKRTTGQSYPFRFRVLFHTLWLGFFLIATGIYITSPQTPINSNIVSWFSLILSIIAFVSVEQLYKNSNYSRFMKFWSLLAGSIFAYDIFLFSYSLIFNHIDTSLWQARGAINAITALALALGSLALFERNEQNANLAISRPVVFYTTSMTAAGAFLALMAIGGYYIQTYGGNWGEVIRVLLLFIAILVISIVYASATLRSKINVWINKNFFRHKYDYREEWLQLINFLSRTPDLQDFHIRAIKAAASIFKSPGGALWIKQHDQFVLASELNIQTDNFANSFSKDSDFCQIMATKEWVFFLQPIDKKDIEINKHLPSCFQNNNEAWLLIPLLVEQDLLGFLILTKSETNKDSSLTWEDLDLLKNVGRQVASYLDRHLASELIAESRQFDAFNKLTAFIMHDLKNLIAQQALVVENAAKHKENPAFIEDAISTIENSVARMSTLLTKLQHNEPTELRSLQLHKVLMEACKKCQNQKPIPSLRLEDSDVVINADSDHLLMSIIHIVKNAQEATPSNGFVDITLRRRGNNAIITIEDNGEGMDEDFIKNRLFKPFVTTKSGKGMGIGVYQAREFFTSLDGDLEVESKRGVGTIFTIEIPTIKN